MNTNYRRNFLKSAGMGMAFMAFPDEMFSRGMPVHSSAQAPEPVNIMNFGAKADSSTDNTVAIQKAIDVAALTGATVIVPAGTFLTSTLKMHPHTALLGYATWSYRNSGGSVLRLCDDKAACLVDITGAYGSVINGLCLDGGGLGKNIHGILLDNSDYSEQEDTPLIASCRVNDFSGDAVRLNRVWCFRVRSCMLSHCAGNGLYVRGWDGFILDNWLTGNRGAGFTATNENSSNTLTGNRIEWNASGGIVCHNGHSYNITGNYIDRSGGPAIALDNSSGFAITGNIFFRSGKPEWTVPDSKYSTHVLMENCRGIVLSGNSLCAGCDDGEKGGYSPDSAIVFSELNNCIIKDNVMHDGAVKNLLLDMGKHGENVTVKDNVGQIL